MSLHHSSLLPLKHFNLHTHSCTILLPPPVLPSRFRRVVIRFIFAHGAVVLSFVFARAALPQPVTSSNSSKSVTVLPPAAACLPRIITLRNHFYRVDGEQIFGE
ncbi:hypothetical protein PIB30_037835 [Stylosanthes scabra]|uniref:Uncharacterized protein n=1 Tax=Stylosanthes scabra TaxID=79078 RepID=A0ABU6SE30_9FABA|nr:hypothetical protein [Stylosanthes scabra]